MCCFALIIPRTRVGSYSTPPIARFASKHRRASAKLERVGLLERERIQLYIRARDPRREGLLFVDGRFCRRTDASRAHAVRRIVVWKSPFGFQIVQRYWPQLIGGTPIRWDARTVNRARFRAEEDWVNRRHREVELARLEEEQRDEVVLADARQAELEGVVPGEVVTKADREHWELAVAVAHDREPGLGAGDLWDMAGELYASKDVASLRAAAAELPRRESPRPSRAEEFRRRPQLELSRSMSGLPL